MKIILNNKIISVFVVLLFCSFFVSRLVQAQTYKNEAECFADLGDAGRCSDPALYQASGTTPPSPPSSSSGSGQCSKGTHLENGLCIPDSPFSGGLTSAKTIPQLILTILKMLLTLSGVIAVLLLIIGGFQYITSGGNEEQAEKGKRTLINSIIGLIIVILSYTIVSVITSTLTKNLTF